MKLTKEHDIEEYLRKKAKDLGILFLKFTSPQHSGVPDRILIKNGLIVFAEIKAPDEKPRKLQMSVLKKLKNHGAQVCVINSIKKADELLSAIQKGSIKKIDEIWKNNLNDDNSDSCIRIIKSKKHNATK